MSASDKTVNVTRGEFYGAMGLLWLYILLILSDLQQLERRWTTLALLGGSLVMTLTYSWLNWRGSRR
jgi:hypothetical protein